MPTVSTAERIAALSLNGSTHASSRAAQRNRLADLLAALGGVAAALAALAGFLPGLYRDPPVLVEQSHGYDIGIITVAFILELAVARAARGSLRGRLVAVGALGCLAYTFVTYAFFVILNPATFLYIAVLACCGWSFVSGFARSNDDEVDVLVQRGLARKTTAVFLALVAGVFGLTWSAQMLGAILNGTLPADLAATGWPMNPVYVLDLGFVVPLATMCAVRLWRNAPGAARMTIPFLVFTALLSLCILLMAISAGFSGQPVAVPMIVIFMTMLVTSSALSATSLATWRR